MSNYPAGYNGEEGREEETYIFYVNGEIEIDHYSEKAAEDELLDMTVRELVRKGIELE